MPVKYKIHVIIHLLFFYYEHVIYLDFFFIIYETRFGHATNHLKFCEIILKTEIYFRIPG